MKKLTKRDHLPKLQVRLDLGEDDWYDMWHVHLDILGKNPARHRDYIVEGMAIYQDFREKAAFFGKPWQSWMTIDPDEPGDDAVYFHTPNPNRDNFPYAFETVVWEKELPALLEGLIDLAQYDVGFSTFENRHLYWIKHKSQK